MDKTVGKFENFVLLSGDSGSGYCIYSIPFANHIKNEQTDNMKQILMILILGLISLGEIKSQDSKRINYQFDFGTTLTIPYKNTIEIWPEIINHPQTDYSSNFGYFLEILISYNTINSDFTKPCKSIK